MTHGIKKRVSAGLMAFAMLFSQVIIPAQPVFATNNGTLKVHEIGTPLGTENSDPKVCAFNLEGFGFDDGQEGYVMLDTQGGSAPTGTDSGPYTVGPALASGYFISQDFNTPGGVSVPNGTYKATMYGKGGSATQQNDKAKSKVFKVDCQPAQATRVTAVNGSFSDICGPEFNTLFVATPVTGVTYVPTVTGSTVTVTATANAGYVLGNPEWSQTYTDQLVACESQTKSATAVDGVFADTCGETFNLTFTPAVTEGVTYHQNKDGNTVTVTAIANEGYVLSNPEWSQTKTDNLTVCPTPTICSESLPTIHSTNRDMNGWNVPADAEYVEDGIKLNVSGNWESTFISRPIVGPLADIGTNVDFMATPNQYAGIHIETDKGTLTYEKEASYGGKWWSESDFGVASGLGYKTLDTLENIVAANPGVMTSLLRVLYTHPQASSSVVTSVTVGCKKYTFDKENIVTEPSVCTVSNNLFIQPWNYDNKTNPGTGGDGSYKFIVDGLHISTPAQNSYVYGQMSAGNTPIRDIDSMSYMTYRDVTSSGNPQIVTAYILYVDLDGNLATDDGTYLFYEPIYNGTVQTGVWQTWDVDSADAKFWSFDLSDGNPSLTWGGIVAEYPNAVAVNYGFNQGTYNQGTNARIQNMVFDCATTVFGVPGSGGVGEEEPTTPTVPSVPTTPTTPSSPSTPVGGQGSVLPAELPMTGENGSVLFTWIALLAAILTYGAAYFVQPKKRFEQ